ncbi:hypothetical protein CLAFUW4_05504 [Fulvia fulva]|uniref:RBR-type E3 ubiquitin transferase n=1 Tax=Passalora fulva TaxID=5499 RepID=A0A9Q8LJ24_PASFU|nr:uncharacterized protein CLAFUR5_05645 [Fulvia fulva]KAK4623704.1 hypothetical protein CLAFUR4_05498 [Fulvia fulva]KAK4624998.1 hypothetical protein CLAFUR0_05506 [Fulvia fulva]UJO18303.1 hypothetical protein CLAFUR5_05645 [Fulvia fulva]WPV15508.1 hypothetical protein CLAFUW4_05504 [Fulvia fulva]WPV29571.1 hypothetical protein CLAFUW7_05502 [Fulvia fulva]
MAMAGDEQDEYHAAITTDSNVATAATHPHDDGSGLKRKRPDQEADETEDTGPAAKCVKQYGDPASTESSVATTATQPHCDSSTRKRERSDEDGDEVEDIAPAKKCIKQDGDAYAGARLIKRKRVPEGDRNGKVKCETCWDRKPVEEAIALECDHTSCYGCVQDLFRQSMKDETLYPPRCCTRLITLDDMRDILPEDLIPEFIAKREELEDPSKCYCHVPTCSAYIPNAKRTGDNAICPTCNSSTCRKCQGASHDGDCVYDPETQALMETAKDLQWQRYPPCGRFLEHNFGCWHMTCPCKHEFCYLCATTWKECKCDLWEEERLLERARIITERERLGRATQGRRNARGRWIPVQAPDGAPRDIAGMAARFRQHAECAHGNMHMYVPGSYECDDCHHVLDRYIHRCDQCRVSLCTWCCMHRRRRGAIRT